jgi:hypothetical protein
VVGAKSEPDSVLSTPQSVRPRGGRAVFHVRPVSVLPSGRPGSQGRSESTLPVSGRRKPVSRRRLCRPSRYGFGRLNSPRYDRSVLKRSG